MIGLVTNKEAEFLVKLADLLKEYNAMIFIESLDEIQIQVFEGGDEKTRRIPITFYNVIDETDILALLEKNKEQVESLTEGKECDLFSGYTSKASLKESVFKALAVWRDNRSNK